MDRHGLVEHVRGYGDGVLSTVGPDGSPQAAYLSLATTERGDLVLDARASSRTVANVRRDPRVAVVVGGSGGSEPVRVRLMTDRGISGSASALVG